MTLLKTLLPSALVALVFGFLGAWLFAWSGLGGNATREWLLANPQILPEMAEAYQANEARTRLAGASDEVVKPFPGAILGNPQGTVTLVEFTDYGCTFCRQSVDDVKALVEAKSGALRGWMDQGRIARMDPVHLLFSIWALTQHYADFDVQVRAVLGTNHDPFDDAGSFLDHLFRRTLSV